MIKLGVLEQGKRPNNTNSLSTIEDIIEYALKTEEYGYSRFWLTEHHYSFPAHPYTNPDILISIIAGMTDRIKVGAAGVLVNLHSLLSIVSNYKLMNNLFHDRIDLGLANGLTDIDYINKILPIQPKFNNARESFLEMVRELSNLIHREDFYFQQKHVVIPPFKGIKPNLWYLSTSYKNTDFIIDNKLNLCRTIFHNYGQKLDKLDYAKEKLIEFKGRFNEKNGFLPEVSLAVAFYMSGSLQESKREIRDKMEDIALKSKSYVIIPTTPDHFQDLLLEYKEKFGMDEFILYDLADSNQGKIENLQILSEKLKLENLLIS